MFFKQKTRGANQMNTQQTPDEWDSFRIGEKIDLDNDGEKELIMDVPYGAVQIRNKLA